MPFLFVSFLSFFLLTKSLSLELLQSWKNDIRWIFLWAQSLGHLKAYINIISNISTRGSDYFSLNSSDSMPSPTENLEFREERCVLDLPDLVLDCIFSKLSPSGLCNMSGVCKSLRERCRDDSLWERHIREKWGKLVGNAAYKNWKLFTGSKNDLSSLRLGDMRGWLGSFSCFWPFSWIVPKIGRGLSSSLPEDSVMSWYLALEKGQFSFPAQVYNRENSHAGFLMSCYDAEVTYDCNTDTFKARYPPHGNRVEAVEESVQWNRLRIPPLDISPHQLHISDCLNDLHPGDHIEIQWRKNKEFPYGWWYGVVGHLEICGNEHICRCHRSDSIILEFNHYEQSSQWRRATINRKDHREEGNETTGFYGGLRKLTNKDEINKWKQLWPKQIWI